MDASREFMRALQETHIHRHRRSRLLTVGTTELPYVLLGESVVNLGDTVVRRGIVRVEQPSIFLLNRPVQLEGFEAEEGDEQKQAVVALGRMAHFPPGKYSNIETELDVFDGELGNAVQHYLQHLDNAEDLLTGLLTGPVEVWPLSLLVYVAAMVAQSAPGDVFDLMMQRFKPRHWS